MYEGLESDCQDDSTLLTDLEKAKEQLSAFYNRHYAPRPTRKTVQASPSTSSISSTSTCASPEKVNFTSRYHKKDRPVTNELDEYFKLSPEDFQTCTPLQWWLGRSFQFPNLYRLACDVLAIPGILHHITYHPSYHI